jgi:hypothetical protein
LIQSRDGPDRYGAKSRFETMPSRPSCRPEGRSWRHPHRFARSARCRPAACRPASPAVLRSPKGRERRSSPSSSSRSNVKSLSTATPLSLPIMTPRRCATAEPVLAGRGWLCSVFEAPAVVAGLDDIAVVRQAIEHGRRQRCWQRTSGGAEARHKKGGGFVQVGSQARVGARRDGSLHRAVGRISIQYFPGRGAMVQMEALEQASVQKNCGIQFRQQQASR